MVHSPGPSGRILFRQFLRIRIYTMRLPKSKSLPNFYKTPKFEHVSRNWSHSRLRIIRKSYGYSSPQVGVGDWAGTRIGEKQAAVIGHDWGAAVAWSDALLRPDIFRA